MRSLTYPWPVCVDMSEGCYFLRFAGSETPSTHDTDNHDRATIGEMKLAGRAENTPRGSAFRAAIVVTFPGIIAMHAPPMRADTVTMMITHHEGAVEMVNR